MKKKLMFLMLLVFMVFAPNLSAARTNSVAVNNFILLFINSLLMIKVSKL